MNAEELVRLAVKLVGDTAEAQKAFAEASSAALNVAKACDTAAAHIDSLTSSVANFGTQMLSALSTLGVAASLRSAFQVFSDAQRTMLRLTAAVEANGRAVAATVDEYTRFADQVASTTLTTKGAALSMLQQAESLGLTGRAAERAVENSVALAAAKGGEAQAFIRAGVAFEQGDARQLRWVLRIRGVHSETEILTKAQALLASGTKIAAAEAESAAGQLQKFQRSLVEVSKDMGRMAAEGLVPLVAQMKQLVDWYKSSEESTKKLVVAALATVAAVGPLIAAFSVVRLVGSSVVRMIVSGATAFMAAKGAVAEHAAALAANAVAAQGAARANAALGLATSAQAKGVGLLGFAGRAAGTTALATGAATALYLVYELYSAWADLSKAQQDATGTAMTYFEEVQARAKATVDAAKAEEAGLAGSVLGMATGKPIGEQSRILQEGIAEAEARMKAYGGALDAARASAEAFFGKGHAKLVENSEEVLKWKARLDAVKATIDKISDAFSKINIPQHISTQLTEMEKKLNFRQDTLGFTATQKALAKIEEDSGRTIPQYTKDWMLLVEAEADEAARMQQVTESTNKHTRALLVQAQTMGMMKEQADVYKLALKGVSDATLASAATAMNMNRVLHEVDKLYKEGEAVRKQHLTPEEKLVEERRNLEQLYRAGAVSLEIYSRSLNKAEDAAKAATGAFKDTALAGSAEAMSRITEFSSRMTFRPVMDTRAGLGASPREALAVVAERTQQEQEKNRGRDQLFMDMREYLRRMAEKQGITLNNVDLP